MRECIVPGCAADGRNNLGVRLRRPDTTAIWAPNTEAFVCDEHAGQGAEITVLYATNSDDFVRVSVHGVDGSAVRTTAIKRAETVADALADRIEAAKSGADALGETSERTV